MLLTHIAAILAFLAVCHSQDTAAVLDHKAILRRESLAEVERHSQDTVKSAPANKGKKAQTVVLADGVDQANTREGACSPFVEGAWQHTSEGALTAEDLTRWPDLTIEQCWSKCTLDPACEQAKFEKAAGVDGKRKCTIGTNFMANNITITDDFYVDKSKVGSGEAGCYAKNGFGNAHVRKVKDGFCHNFAEGWKVDYVEQCDLHSTSVEHQEECSHWGTEYDMTEIGCWSQCESKPACTQAVYDHSTSNCWIGTGHMDKEPGFGEHGLHQCPTCKNKCFAKHGFAGETA